MCVDYNRLNLANPYAYVGEANMSRQFDEPCLTHAHTHTHD